MTSLPVTNFGNFPQQTKFLCFLLEFISWNLFLSAHINHSFPSKIMPSHTLCSEDHPHLFKCSLPTARCVHCSISLYILTRATYQFHQRYRYRHLRRQNAFLVKRVECPNLPPPPQLDTTTPIPEWAAHLTLENLTPPNDQTNQPQQLQL